LREKNPEREKVYFFQKRLDNPEQSEYIVQRTTFFWLFYYAVRKNKSAAEWGHNTP
jgi:hypothetical protein